MTKKDYIRIAQVLKNFKKRFDNVPDRKQEPIKETIDYLINMFSISLRQDNWKFDESKFRDYILTD